MTTADRLYQVTQQLPESMLAELLDFAEFLRQRKLPDGGHGQADNLTLLDLQGGLESSVAFSGDPLVIQEKMRDEWH